jgi:hypothetical protein
MLSKEPAVIIAAVAALVQAVAIYFTGDPEADVTQWAAPVLTMLAGLLTRGRVFSHNTVREAGYTPKELQTRADSPSIRTAPEGE